jgi:hypothetical protein
VTLSEMDPLTDRAAFEVKRSGTIATKANAMDNSIGLKYGSHIGQSLKYPFRYRPINWPNMPPPYADEQPRRIRAAALLAVFRDAVTPVRKGEWRVRSSTGHAFYRVVKTPKGYTCECGDQDDRHLDCKHIWAVVLSRHPEEYASVLPEGESEPKFIDRRDWPNYSASRKNEALEFDSLLWDLLLSVPEPERPLGRPGRPRNSFRNELFHAIKKVYYSKSSDWTWGELTKVQQSGSGLFERVLNNTTPSRVFNRESSEGTLLRLVELAARPMQEMEEHGTVAIDSTGFATTVRPCYNDQVHSTGRKRRFVKMHVIIGTRSHAILAIAVTDDRGADSPQLIPLIQRVIDAGFLPETFTGDKGYLSREAYSFLSEHGIDGYIPFKISNTGQSRGSPEYHRKCLQFAMHRKDFEAKYHARSNVESVFGAIKKRLQEGLRSKNQGAMFCEVLAKAICWNISALIRLSYENQVELTESRAGTYAQDRAPREPISVTA